MNGQSREYKFIILWLKILTYIVPAYFLIANFAEDVTHTMQSSEEMLPVTLTFFDIKSIWTNKG